MTRNIITNLLPLIRIEPQNLVHQLLEITIIPRTRAREPLAAKPAIQFIEWDRTSEDFRHIERRPNRVHEDLRGRNTLHPLRRDRAIEETAGVGYRTHTMRDCIDGRMAVLLADPFKASADIESRVIGRPIVLGDHQLADAMHGDKNAVTCSGEIIHSIDFDGGEGEDLLIHGSTRNHEEVDWFDLRVTGFPNVKEGADTIRGDDLDCLIGRGIVDVASVCYGWVLLPCEGSEEQTHRLTGEETHEACR